MPDRAMPMADDPVALRSPFLFGLFSRYAGWYFGRNFRALRIAREGLPIVPGNRPVIVCSNHPSWWDPLIFILLTGRLFPGRRGFGPMDRAALGRYGLLRRMGIFGIEPGTTRGGRDFLRACNRILQDDAHILWITGEGGFTDPRTRPVRLRPGLAHLAQRAERAVILPMAVEYCFWNERFPETLVRFGPPVTPGGCVAETTARLEAALQTTMDALAADSISRDASRFLRLRAGRRGMGGLYSLYGRLRAALTGAPYQPDHTPDRTGAQA